MTFENTEQYSGIRHKVTLFTLVQGAGKQFALRLRLGETVYTDNYYTSHFQERTEILVLSDKS